MLPDGPAVVRAGTTADDNPRGRNGLFTKHLLTVLDQPGLDIEDGFEKVVEGVLTDSRNSQEPWREGYILGDLVLRAATADDNGEAPPPPTTGGLRISSRPAGAAIHIDGQPRGTAPLSLQGLAVGSLTVRAELAGHIPAEQRVRIRAGRLVAGAVQGLAHAQFTPIAAVEVARRIT